MTLPSSMEEGVRPFSVAFTRPSFQRFLHLLLATILTTGNRTVCNLLRTLAVVTRGHQSSFHRLFSQRRWLALKRAHALCTLIFGVNSGSVE